MDTGIAKMIAFPHFFQDGSEAYGRWTFDVMHFVLVQVLIRGIVLGVILETFGLLREQRAKSEEDWLSRCFVCDLSTPDLEHHVPGGFSHHTEHEHRVWDYLFFLHYVQRSAAVADGMMLTSEQHVARCLVDLDVAFFPIGRSLAAESMGFQAQSADDEENDDSGHTDVSTAKKKAQADATTTKTTKTVHRLRRLQKVRSAVVELMKERVRRLQLLIEDYASASSLHGASLMKNSGASSTT